MWITDFLSKPFLIQETKITPHEEQYSWLALVPVLATSFFYLLPLNLQQNTLIQFFPQLSAYLVMGIWFARNSNSLDRLGLKPIGVSVGVKWGGVTGLLLGAINVSVILWVVPSFGWDIQFLKETPHAQVPTWIMVPWVIVLIAFGVELNFRGFVLGRLERVFLRGLSKVSLGRLPRESYLAVLCSAMIFAFDPFMVATFQHLHWIAVWDGLIWGWLFAQKKNLFMVVVAHAVEVVILYLSIKAALT